MTSHSEHEIYMQRCLQLARNGLLTAAPNPMVGAVVVGPDGRILGEGWHLRAGLPHAEVNALNAVRREDWPLLPQSTIYVSLEPCAHYGRTPPCAELIVRRGLKRCVVGCRDPFSRVQGRGIEILRQAGIEVIEGVLQEECLRLNRMFVCRHSLGRPFITLKWAQTQDGWIGRRAERLFISDEVSLMHCHKLRAQHQAIVVGHRTLVADTPQLNVRYWGTGSNTPTFRAVLGRVGEEELPRGWQAFAHIDDLLEHLVRNGHQSLLVEGGAEVLQSFIERDLWDEAWCELSPVQLGKIEDGVRAPQMPRGFSYDDAIHFGRTFRHWESPLLKDLYGCATTVSNSFI